VDLVSPHHLEAFTKQNIKDGNQECHISHWVGCLKWWYDISSPPHNQMVVPPNDLQKMVGIAVSVVIGCLHFDKRK
jgi:hypothetical protein